MHVSYVILQEHDEHHLSWLPVRKTGGRNTVFSALLSPPSLSNTTSSASIYTTQPAWLCPQRDKDGLICTAWFVWALCYQLCALQAPTAAALCPHQAGGCALGAPSGSPSISGPSRVSTGMGSTKPEDYVKSVLVHPARALHCEVLVYDLGQEFLLLSANVRGKPAPVF